ncbi:hypothetical protein HMPREF0058_1927, partial [Actinomyces urogenitalis DSM 15434]
MAEAGTQVEAILRSPVDEATRVHLGTGALGVVVAPALASCRARGMWVMKGRVHAGPYLELVRFRGGQPAGRAGGAADPVL